MMRGTLPSHFSTNRMYPESGGGLTGSFARVEETNHDKFFGTASPHDPHALLGISGLVRADAPKDEKAIAEGFLAFAKKEAAAYSIRLEGSDRPLTLQPEPVLKWSNPVMGDGLRRCVRLDRRRSAGGRGFDLQVLLGGPPSGQRVPLAGIG